MSASKLKKTRAAEVARISSRISKDSSRLNAGRYAAALVSPKDVGPIVMPSPTPGRAGSATFPLVIEIDAQTDFGLICQPDLFRPLQVAIGDVEAESSKSIAGGITTVTVPGPVSAMHGTTPCVVSAVEVGGRLALPIQSSVGGTFSWQMTLQASDSNYGVTIALNAWSDEWKSLATTTLTPIGNQGNTIVTPVDLATNETHYSFSVVSATGIGLFEINYELSPIAPTVMTCAPAGVITRLTTHSPDWATVLLASQRVRVVACDMLVTYEGSTLNNGGSISVCNTDDELLIVNSYYETVASRPHDMYRGRLASEGKTEGGIHWHYIPDHPMQLLMLDLQSALKESFNYPRGYVGVKGKTAGEVVRIECNYTLNFYSLDPAFQMMIQPSYDGFGALLYALRTQIPLVTSNDTHLEKLGKFMSRGANKTYNLAKAGLDFHDKYGDEIANALNIISKMLG